MSKNKPDSKPKKETMETENKTAEETLNHQEAQAAQPEAAQEAQASADIKAASEPEAPAETEEPKVEMIELETYLRLAAEYDNYRKRTQREKETIYQDAKANMVAAFLPVYDNLERALNVPCTDEAYKKGVEMTMTGLKEILAKLGVEEIPAENCPFDATLHNAVMHVEDENVGENTVVECFQKGFRIGEKVIRFAMVKVAN